MPDSAPLELLTDASGSVTLGWLAEGVFYARFSRSLSAQLGAAFAARLRAALQAGAPIRYYGDARALESYDLLARSAFVRVVSEHRKRFQRLKVLAWPADVDSLTRVLGVGAEVTSDVVEFESALFASSPQARQKLDSRPDVRARWPLRR